jgi:hypothetical protein
MPLSIAPVFGLQFSSPPYERLDHSSLILLIASFCLTHLPYTLSSITSLLPRFAFQPSSLKPNSRNPYPNRDPPSHISISLHSGALYIFCNSEWSNKQSVPRSILLFLHTVQIMLTVRSRDGDWLRAGRPRSQSSSPSRVKNSLFSTSPRLALGSTQPPIQWVLGALSPRVKPPKREADHSPQTSAEVKKTSPPYVFMVQCLIS